MKQVRHLTDRERRGLDKYINSELSHSCYGYESREIHEPTLLGDEMRGQRINETHVGKRLLLFREHEYPYTPFEATILEMSPSQQWVKLRYEISDNITWIARSELCIYELLEVK